MKNSLDHLPRKKQRELERVVKILFEEFEDALSGRIATHHRRGRILKIILFGSYARGDWVDEGYGGYQSDYDLMVLVNHEKLTDVPDYWAKADDHLIRDFTITHRLKNPVNFVVHSLSDFKTQLKLGRYFFVDIYREGILLYSAPGHPFGGVKPLTPDIALAEAETYFKHWFPRAARRLKISNIEAGESRKAGKGDSSLEWRRDAALTLHQAAERLYMCLLLVLTLYVPKTHRLSFLRSTSERYDPRLIAAWPRNTRLARRQFELVRRAYVEARYSPHYKITTKELDWIAGQITVLQGLVQKSCKDHLAKLRASLEVVRADD